METPPNDTFALVYALTERVMRWYGFSHEYHYSMLSLALPVAVEVVKRAATPGITTPDLRERTLNRLTREDVEAADAATGDKMRLMWEACNASTYQYATRPSTGGE